MYWYLGPLPDFRVSHGGCSPIVSPELQHNKDRDLAGKSVKLFEEPIGQVKQMRVRYDAKIDAAYISLLEEGERTFFGFTYACDPVEVQGQIHLDFDESGRLTGIEILDASKKLPTSLLKGQ